MTDLDEMITLIKKGLWDEALSRVAKLENNLDKVQVLIFIGTELYSHHGDLEGALQILGDAEYYSNKIKAPARKAIAYANLGFAYSLFGDYESAGELFLRALDNVDKLDKMAEKGEVLGIVAQYLGMAGMIEDAIEYFEEAFDLIVNSKIEYVQKLDLLIKLGDLMVNSGDYLQSKEALYFYERAYDLFDKLRVSDRAADVEKKIYLCRTLPYSGTPEVRKALKEGRYAYITTKVLQSDMSNKDKLIALLEIALWLKKMNILTYKDTVEEALKLMDISELSGEELEHVATLLTELGKLKHALKLAVNISNVEKQSEAFKGIALALAGNGQFIEAERIIKEIPDPDIRNEAMNELKKIILSR
ncbi:hypothetical protein PAP_01615 [Palaeococcus pacificus DY20341]|uniref:Uncharacterized protein n=1 Tax=Palaeococcus pacificus DY20341 TaxID=1343739 RepID=A0A075LS40_9EURY|nr:tetratricopeptide repeat protein [Palaeococcus pacificus]AIF68762.1 hypothetical protein PAP_01615 [Palaeococcus pacificus DY20341]